MAPAASRMAPAAALMDELVEEILIRIPPNDPPSLLSAALVCKRWGRVVSAPGFRRRLGELHRTAPRLGFLFSPVYCSSSTFVSTASFHPWPADFCRTVDARHGRVLLHRGNWDREGNIWDEYFELWDPIAARAHQRVPLPLLPRPRYQKDHRDPNLPFPYGWNAAVLCASVSDDALCDHLGCDGGPFLVVFVASGRPWVKSGMCALVYSSEAAAWSQWIDAPHLVGFGDVELEPSALAGNSLYFLCSKSVLKFDVVTREMSLIDLPPPQHTFRRPILRATPDGGLGLARICSDGLQLWSREIVGPHEDLVWAQSQVIKLRDLLLSVIPPDEPLGSPCLTGSAHGRDVVFVGTRPGIFAIHLKSHQVTKVCQFSWLGAFTFPYMRFCIPALGAAASAE